MATIVESSMDKVGESAEQEYEAELSASTELPSTQTTTKAKRIRLSTGQRMRLVEDFRKGKLDKYYSVTIDKKRPGEFRITKRRKPLDTPEIEVTAAPDDIPVPPATTTQGEIMEPALPASRSPLQAAEPVKQTKTLPIKSDKPDKVNIEFYAMQNNINNSLSREIQAVMEKCNKIERKMKEQRAEAKAKRRAKPDPEPVEYEYEYSDGDEAQAPEQIQLNQPQQYRAFNARSRINLLRDFR